MADDKKNPKQLFDGRPVIGICSTRSELTPCNAHFRILAERVKCGVREAAVSATQPVMQADTGCDFDFLVGRSGAPVPRESR